MHEKLSRTDRTPISEIPRSKKPRGRPPSYPWDKWFGQGSFTVRRGTHYHCSQSSMCQQIRQRAAKDSLHISLEDRTDSIRVTRRD